MDLGLYKVAVRQYLKNLRKAYFSKEKKDIDTVFRWRSVCEDLDPHFSLMDKAFNNMMKEANG